MDNCSNKARRAVKATLSRIFDESSEQTDEGYKKIRSILMKHIGQQYGKEEVLAYLKYLAQEGVILEYQDPFEGDSLYMGLITDWVDD